MKRFIATTALTVMMATSAFAEGVVHRVAVHVDQNDPQVMNMALNNVANLTSYYEAQGDTVMVELVAYGPGLNMFVPGKSPVEDRISTMSLEMENLSFAACGNTLRNMSKKAGKDITLMDEATIVPSGVVRLIELQEKDYAYIRP
ncbi:DsrE family protein [Sulfitobacter sp. S223]|uniref:DsrE family protein n=1 Tax=Sulfitobacter sp. S223 TaxID=2867023 RepID=UPI0021A8F800|nr:DsrE family protein [Sulfitobacter sp. S223]UWR27775.1 DsrE family protein [Sulfitobacter sp. S223]